MFVLCVCSLDKSDNGDDVNNDVDDEDDVEMCLRIPISRFTLYVRT